MQHSDKNTNIQQRKPFEIFEQQAMSRIFDVYISGPIGSPIDYTEMLNLFYTASPNDVIRMHLNTPGGSVHTSVQMISAMKQTAALVITIAEGEVASAGTFLLFSGDEIHVKEHSTLMIHNFSGITGGKGHEVFARTDHWRDYFPKLIRDIYYPFLTEDELLDVSEGKDMWLSYDQIVPRLEKFGKYKQQENQNRESDEELDSEDLDEREQDNHSEQEEQKKQKAPPKKKVTRKRSTAKKSS